MALPSFDELLSEARRIGAANTEAQGFNRGGLVAQSLSNFVDKLLTTQGKDHATNVGAVDPNTGTYSPYDKPQVEGRSLMERMMGVQGVDKSATGIPITAADSKVFALERLKHKTTPDHISSDESPIGSMIAAEALKEGIPVNDKTTFKQLKILSPEYAIDPSGNIKKTSIFGNFKNLSKPDKIGGVSKWEQTKLDDAKSTLAIISNLENNFGTLPTGVDAIASKGASLLTFGAFGNKPQRIYDDTLKANAVKFYRAYTQDTRLSDADAKERAMGILPGSSLDKEVAKGKFSEIRGNILRNVAPILERAGVSESDFLNGISSMNKNVTGGEQPSGGGFTPDKKARLEELRRKQREGTLQR